MRTLVTVMLLTFGAMVQAGPVEIWECKERYAASWEAILVTATVEEGRKKGNISVAGVTHVSQFEVAGFDRRWDFSLLPDFSYRYAFIIEPNGDARYFDFGNEKKAMPSNFMKCRQKRAAKAPH
jgi:hypothetical protein